MVESGSPTAKRESLRQCFNDPALAVAVLPGGFELKSLY